MKNVNKALVRIKVTSIEQTSPEAKSYLIIFNPKMEDQIGGQDKDQMQII